MLSSCCTARLWEPRKCCDAGGCARQEPPAPGLAPKLSPWRHEHLLRLRYSLALFATRWENKTAGRDAARCSDNGRLLLFPLSSPWSRRARARAAWRLHRFSIANESGSRRGFHTGHVVVWSCFRGRSPCGAAQAVALRGKAGGPFTQRQQRGAAERSSPLLPGTHTQSPTGGF